ncbi:hypothetical protein GCM10027051_15890 [Niabella terrae]
MKYTILLAGFVCLAFLGNAQAGKLMAEKSGKNGVIIHKVQSGEGLYSLSKYYDVKVSEIAAANGFASDKGLLLGQEVKVPLNAANLSAKKTSSPVYYTVSGGESLGSISNLFEGLTVKELKSLNKISGSNVNKGEELLIGYLKSSGPSGADKKAVATAVITGSNINIRKGPSTDDAVVGTGQAEDKVEIIRKVNSEWTQIRLADGTEGYIAAQFLGKSGSTGKATKAAAKTITAIVTGSDINVRKGPSTDDAIVGTVQTDDKVEVLRKVDEAWSQIRLSDGNEGYIASRFLGESGSTEKKRPAAVQGKPAVISGTNINIRKGPSTDDAVVGVGQPDDKVTVLREVDSEWSQIRTADGTEGYMVSRFLAAPGSKPSQPEPKEQTVTRPVQVAPSSHTSQAVISGTNINIRKGPSTEETVVGVAQLNDQVIVLQQVNQEWSEIVGADGTRGYIASRFMTAGEGGSTESQRRQEENKQATAVVKEKITADQPAPAPAATAEQGYFAAAYAAGTNPNLTEKKTVNSGIFKTDRGWSDGQYYLLMDNVATGTIVKLTNPANQKIVYAKVLGKMQGVKYSDNFDLRISEAAANKLGLGKSARFQVDVTY